MSQPPTPIIEEEKSKDMIKRHDHNKQDSKRKVTVLWFLFVEVAFVHSFLFFSWYDYALIYRSRLKICRYLKEVR